MHMQRKPRTALAMIGAALLASAPLWAGTAPAPRLMDLGDPGLVKVNPEILHDAMRKVYVDQILWTRMVTLSVLDGGKGKEAYVDRLMENYEACEELLVPYYGNGAEKFAELLEEHVALTVEVMEAIRAGEVFASVLPPWYENGDRLASVMTELNPKFWPEWESRMVWRKYLDSTLDNALARLKGDWKADVQSYDALHLHALVLADYMSLGMQRQFGPIK